MKVKMGIGFLEGDKRPPREAFQTWWEPPGKADRNQSWGGLTCGNGDAVEGSSQKSGPEPTEHANTTACSHQIGEESFILCEIPSAHHDTRWVYPKLHGCLKSNF